VNHYERLKVTQDAPPEVIRAAYRALANRLHPDRSGGAGVNDASHEQMVALNAAYEVLIDPALRSDYDVSLSAMRDWRVASTTDPAAHRERDPFAGVVPGDLTAPVTAWAPGMKHMLLAGSASLALVVAGVAWYLKSDSLSIDAMGDRFVSQSGSASIDVFRRGEGLAVSTDAVGGETPRPTVEELSRMSDEELLAALPALDGRPASRAPSGSRSPAAPSASATHPLDGSGLSLRSDQDLLASYVGRAALDNP
jgi:curved DNA-binding protein CbpA